MRSVTSQPTSFGLLALDRDSDRVGDFQGLISQAHQTSGQRVVLLIDDYDKPMRDSLLEPARVRDLLDGLKPTGFTMWLHPTNMSD